MYHKTILSRFAAGALAGASLFASTAAFAGEVEVVDPGSLFYLAAVENIEPPTDERGIPWNAGSNPTPDVLCDATPVPFAITDVALANGHRIPAYPDAPRETLATLASAARDERARGAPPHKSRELFRTLKRIIEGAPR